MEQTAPAGRRPVETQVAMGGDAVRHGAWGLLQVQLLSGMGASVVSALALTPFDVVKTRIQMLDGAIGCGHHGSLALHGCCVHPAAVLGSKELRPGAVQTVRCMVRNEGLHSLWRGSAFSTFAAVPSVGIYMAIYEQIKAKLQTGASGHDRSWAPLVSGASARSLTTIFTSPLELVRMRLMAERGKQSSGPFAVIRAAVRESGWISLWKGIGPSLYRDVPFSAIYWMLAETLRGRLRVSFPALHVAVARWCSCGRSIAGATLATCEQLHASPSLRKGEDAAAVMAAPELPRSKSVNSTDLFPLPL